MTGRSRSPRPCAAFDVQRADRSGMREVSRRPRPGAIVIAGLALSIVALPCHAADKPAAKPPAAAKSVKKPAAKPEPADATSARFLDGIVAVVDGDPITLRELKRYGVTNAPFLPPDIRGNYQALLDSMIEHRLLRSEFEKHGITASNAMVDRYIAGVLEDTRQTREKLEADIVKAGLSWNDYYERMREEVQRIQLINLQIRARVNVPEEEVREVWESDAKFLEDEKIEVGAIFVPAGADRAKSLEHVQEVRKQAVRDFEDAAKEHSKGPGASEGGHLGDFKRGTMAAHFEKGLKGLGEGDVSEPIEGPGGWYIVTIFDVKASGRRPFEEVKEELAEKLYEQRLQERYQKWATTDLRRDHRVDILVENLAVIAANVNAPADSTSSAPSLVPPPDAGTAAVPPAPAGTPEGGGQ